MAIYEKVFLALQPLDEFLKSVMLPDVFAIAKDKSPALLAFATAILRWPDRRQPKEYVTGFRIIGDFEPSQVFRSLPYEEPFGLDGVLRRDSDFLCQ